MTDVTAEQIQALGLAHHRGDAVSCPICTACLRVAERARMGRVSVPLRFICPRHGVIGEFDPPDLRTPWPEPVVQRLLADYLRHGEARCPEDGAKLGVVYRSGEVGEYAHFACPSCGRVRGGPITSPRLAE